MGGTRVGDGAVEQQQQQERHLLVGRAGSLLRLGTACARRSQQLTPTPSARLAFRKKNLMLAGFREGI